MAGCKPKAAPMTPVGDYTGKVVIDPINRIEGHLRIEVEVENGRVKNAWSSSQLFRGLEIILKGRDPRDAKHFTQRSCGVCTHVHALASTRCMDNAIGVDKRIPETGRVLRNMLMGAQFLHDHIVHFYHLHALDWVDVVSALSANAKKAAEITNTAGLGHRKHTVAEFEAKRSDGTLRHVGLPESVDFIAAQMGWTLDRKTESIDPVMATEATDAGYKPIAKGMCRGVHQVGRGFIGDNEVITLTFTAAVAEPESYEEVKIEGEPAFDSRINGGIHGDTATCAVTLNTVRSILNATPGLKTMADLPATAWFAMA